MLAQTTLRNILGTRTLSGILSEREQVSNEVLSILDTATDPWGIAVERNRDMSAKIVFNRAISSVMNFVISNILRKEWK